MEDRDTGRLFHLNLIFVGDGIVVLLRYFGETPEQCLFRYDSILIEFFK